MKTYRMLQENLNAKAHLLLDVYGDPVKVIKSGRVVSHDYYIFESNSQHFLVCMRPNGRDVASLVIMDKFTDSSSLFIVKGE